MLVDGEQGAFEKLVLVEQIDKVASGSEAGLSENSRNNCSNSEHLF